MEDSMEASKRQAVQPEMEPPYRSADKRQSRIRALIES
jgi:hypothetical protein